MLAKSKLKRLKTQLSGLGLTQDEIVETVGTNKVRLQLIYTGKTYDKAIIQKLIALRDKKIQEAKELEATI